MDADGAPAPTLKLAPQRMPDGKPVASTRCTRWRPGGARGRDDARRLDLGGRGPNARRRNRGQLGAARLVGQAPSPPAASGDPRGRRSRRVAEDRLPRAGVLRQRAARRRGGRARGDRRLHVGPDDLLLTGPRRRAVLRSPGCRNEPDQGPARLGGLVLARRGGPADGDLHRLHRRDQPAARPATRLRIPRRRAQDDLLLRGRRPPRSRPAPRSTRACTRAAGRASC